MKPELKAFIAIAIIITSSSYVYAAEPSGASISGETDLGQYEIMPPSSTSIIESGNITGANLRANMSTYRWAGLTGNVTGLIVLADASNISMFTWTASGRVVFASNESSITWSSLENASSSVMPTYIATAANDNYTNTFTGSGALDSDMFTITAERATTTSGGATIWYTYALNATEGLVWAGEVEEDGTDYSGKIADYQMIIPEDGTGGDETSNTYYLWVELR